MRVPAIVYRVNATQANTQAHTCVRRHADTCTRTLRVCTCVRPHAREQMITTARVCKRACVRRRHCTCMQTNRHTRADPVDKGYPQTNTIRVCTHACAHVHVHMRTHTRTHTCDMSCMTGMAGTLTRAARQAGRQAGARTIERARHGPACHHYRLESRLAARHGRPATYLPPTPSRATTGHLAGHRAERETGPPSGGPVERAQNAERARHQAGPSVRYR